MSDKYENCILKVSSEKIISGYINSNMWRFGLGKMSISDSEYSETSVNFGLQYFANGLNENGFGIGGSSSFASKDVTYSSGFSTYSYSLEERTSELELMYNINIDNGFSITPAYITGSVTQSIASNNLTHMENSYSLSGFGIYLNFPSIVKSGQGLSLFVKKLSVEEVNKDITLAGLQFVW